MSNDRNVLELAARYGIEYIESLDSAAVDATVSLEELRARFQRPLQDAGVDAKQVIEDLVADADGGLVATAGGRFFGWVIGGSVPASTAADWLTVAWDQNAGMYACSPASAVVEEVAGAWLLDLLGLPATASFCFVTGCQMAHFTCLAAARHAILTKAGWDFIEDGLFGAPSIRIITSEEVHTTIPRAAGYLGIGKRAMIRVPSDAEGKIRLDILKDELSNNPDTPTIVVLHAGDLSMGAFDPFEEAIKLAHEVGAWVHVDGAIGLWVAASRKYKHLLKGVEQADSWAADGHKWLNVPYDSGYAFIADREAHKASTSARASYLTHADDARDQVDWNPEFSRRARGFATYAAIRELGRNGIEQIVDQCCFFASELVSGIGDLAGAEIVWKPRINQGLVRFPDPRPGATVQDHDARTEYIMAHVAASGDAFFTGVTWQGRRCMRVSVSSWRTADNDIGRSITAVRNALNS